ncbi:MAG: hypothetical protein ACKKL6_00115 [Candidatus Komeilibacteria bacterium]
MGVIVQQSSHTFSMGESPDYDSEGRPWYDTKEGIAQHVTSLNKLNILEQARHEAYYQRKERLNEFIVLGKWNLDTCGNFMKGDLDLKTIMPNIPDVLTRKEFAEYCAEHWPKSRSSMTGWQGSSDIPPEDLVCPHCGTGWTIESCFDVIMYRDSTVISMTNYVGKTLAEVQAHFSEIKDAVYRIGGDLVIRSDAYIDNSPKYPNPEQDWEKDIVVNESGWLRRSDGISNDYVVKEGDECYFDIWTLYHHECNEKRLELEYGEKFTDIFTAAGFTSLQIDSIPNQYCRCEYCAPWYKVQTEYGTFTIGWRKRVININWEEVDPQNKLDLESLFEKEKTTKGSTGIHAHGWDKAQEYLTLIKNKLAA